MTKLIRFVMPVAIAVVLGPLIAGITVFLFIIADSIFAASGSIAEVVRVSGAFVIFAYMIGGPIAILGGLLVSLWMLSRPPSLLIILIAAAIATVVYMGIGALGLLGPVEFTNARSNFLFTLVLALIAAAGCWFLTRRWARPR